MVSSVRSSAGSAEKHADDVDHVEDINAGNAEKAPLVDYTPEQEKKIMSVLSLIKNKFI